LPAIQVAQLMLTILHDAIRGQSRSPNMVPFDMLQGSCARRTKKFKAFPGLFIQ